MLDSIILPKATTIKITSGTILHEMKPELFVIIYFSEYKINKDIQCSTAYSVILLIFFISISSWASDFSSAVMGSLSSRSSWERCEITYSLYMTVSAKGLSKSTRTFSVWPTLTKVHKTLTEDIKFPLKVRKVGFSDSGNIRLCETHLLPQFQRYWENAKPGANVFLLPDIKILETFHFGSPFNVSN